MGAAFFYSRKVGGYMKRLFIVPAVLLSALAFGSNAGMEFEITKMRNQAEATWTVGFPNGAADIDLKFNEKGLPAEQLEILLTGAPRIATIEINGKSYKWTRHDQETIDLSTLKVDKIKGVKVKFEEQVRNNGKAVVSLKSHNRDAFTALERLSSDRALRLTAAEPDGKEPVVIPAEGQDVAVANQYPNVTQGNGVNVYVIGNNNQIRVNEQPKPVEVTYKYQPSTYYTGWYYQPTYYWVYYPTWTYTWYYPTVTYYTNYWYANYWGYYTWTTNLYAGNFYGTNNNGLFGQLFHL